MPGTLANIIAGPLTVYEAPLSEALPEIDDLAPPTITVTPAGNWVASGFTEEEFHLVYTPDYQDVQTNEHCTPVTGFLATAAAEFSYVQSEDDLTAYERSISESTLTTVAAAADQTAQDQLGVGGESSTITLRSLLITGLNPEGGSRLVHVYRSLVTGPSDWARSRAHMNRTVTYRFYADPSQTDGEQVFKLYDITAAASS
jgi:hypothetical protein